MPAESQVRISVVTPTYLRPEELSGLLANLSCQTVLPMEAIVVDGAPAEDRATEQAVAALIGSLPFECIYVRSGGGTALQRNVGIERARGDFIAFVDDDIRLQPDYFEHVLSAYAKDPDCSVGGIAAYVVNQHLNPATSPRWRWYRRLRLFTTYEPGHYDYQAGYPINRYLQPPHEEIRPVDFMSSNCAVWRRQVFDQGLRFSAFFCDYGVLEDAHLALRAGRTWKLWEYGRARCTHHHSPRGRVDQRRLAWKTAVNYRYVFMDIVPRRTWKQECRFWTVQAVDLVRLLSHATRHRQAESWSAVRGKIEGIVAAARLRPGGQNLESRLSSPVAAR